METGLEIKFIITKMNYLYGKIILAVQNQLNANLGVKYSVVKAINIFLLVFYSFGSSCLPLADFSLLQYLPEMYQHCKATEDKDMAPLDFLTDHLINIDSLFDRHSNGDEQKPHSPLQNQHISHFVVFQIPTVLGLNSTNTFFVKQSYLFCFDLFVKSEYISKVFRPPIVHSLV
ncbi:hypothetical protein [Daejeonella sp.]|uniref:hypothetical protein n=1 Tax=Daejeonella sp. TaxID=2805397 RepID=UPI0030C0F928